MEILQLNTSLPIHQGEKVQKKITKFQSLLGELGERALPEGIATTINTHILSLNEITTTTPVYIKELRKKQSKILALLQKELKLVPKGYYRTLWMAVGMSAFGISFGVAFGVALDNMAFLGLGIPIGMGIGIAVGTAMDAKAQKENKQLEFSAV